MQKLTSLMILIGSMAKAEKRYFRLYSGIQSGDKKYIHLFNLIEAGGSVEEVHARFCEKYASASFDMAVKHLYQTILDCLTYLHRKHNVQAKIFSALAEAGVFYERALYEEAMERLAKAKKLASTYEQDVLMIYARQMELRYMNANNFKDISEKQLVGKQMKIVEELKYARNANLHSQLYDILKHRLLHKGYARSERQKESLNDLVLSELNIVANNSYKGFEAQKLHLLFQASYYLDSGNYKMAIRFYQMLIDLFDENKHMILNPPVYYLQAIAGILNSLEGASLYKEMPFFINKLKEIEQGDYTLDFILNLRAQTFGYEFGYLFNTGCFDAATALVESYDETLFKSMHLLRLDNQLKLLIRLVILDVAIENFHNAQKNMKKIIISGKLFYAFPEYIFARLLNLVIQAELGNDEFFDNEVKAIKRNLSQTSATERLLFRFIHHYHALSQKSVRERLLALIRREQPKIAHDKYERQLLMVFDFLSWMESRLTNRRFDEILKEKNSTIGDSRASSEHSRCLDHWDGQDERP